MWNRRAWFIYSIAIAAVVITGMAGCGSEDLSFGAGGAGGAGTGAGAQGSAGCAKPALTIHVNRNGGTYTRGLDNSAANTSIILIPETFTAHAPPLAQWDATMDCLRAVWAPYDVRVTDVEPNASEPPYMEVAVVAEAGTDIGYPAGVTGVAPHSCGVLPSAVGFVFVGSLSSSEPTVMCNQINYLAGIFFGLEAVDECTDVMSWLLCDGGPRTFADQELKCYDTPGCECDAGATTQNSHATLLARAGAATCN